MAKAAPSRIAILGAGPIGLEAAVYALKLGHTVNVFEQGTPGEFVNRWGFVRMFTPFGLNCTKLGKQHILQQNQHHEFPADTAIISGREYRDAYLLPLAETPSLKSIIKLQTTVLGIGRTGWRKSEPTDSRKALPPFRLLVREASGAERYEAADAILDCTGTYGKPNWVGDGGIPAAGETASRAHSSYWLEDVRGAKVNHYAGRSIVLIGSGYSAGTTVCELASLAEEHQSTWIIWLTHGPRTQPLPRLANDPFKERDRLAAKANHLAMRCDGNLEYHPQTQLEEVLSHGPDKGFRIAARIAGKPMTWDVERVIANVGYRPEMSFCSELHIAEPIGEIRTGEPGYFILGAKCLGRNSQFLLTDGHDQIRQAFTILQGDTRLNLHAA